MSKHIPIYSGEKLNSDERVEGFLSTTGLEGSLTFSEHPKDTLIIMSDRRATVIDPSTLAISFDSGVSFKSIKDVAEALDLISVMANRIRKVTGA